MLKKIKAQIAGLVVSGVVFFLPMFASASAWSAGKSNAQGVGLPGGAIYQIISTTLSWLLGIFGFIAIIGFVVAGIFYLTAAGDEGQAEKGKNGMKYSIIGIIVALMGWVVVQAVDRWLSGTNNAF